MQTNTVTKSKCRKIGFIKISKPKYVQKPLTTRLGTVLTQANGGRLPIGK